MEFVQRSFVSMLGEKIGFSVSYLFFTTVVYFLLRWMQKLPEGFGYFSVMLVTLAIILVGIFLRLVIR